MFTPKLKRYLLLTFALTWGLAFGHQIIAGGIASPSFVPMLVVMMWLPAVSAIVVQRGMYGEPLADLGLRWRWSRWLPLSALLVVPFILLTLVIGWLMPGVEFASGADALLEQLTAAGAPIEQTAPIETARDTLGNLFFVPAFGLFMLTSIVAGLPINLLAALGEELGWRGLMQRELEPLGFWRMNLVVGVAWGVWHAPIIWQGYNYPQTPQWGVLFMTAFAVLLSPLHAYVRQRSGTVLAPSILHGTINAAGTTVMLFVQGGSDLTVGITGAAGLLALVVVNGLLWRHLRQADRPIMTKTRAPSIMKA